MACRRSSISVCQTTCRRNGDAGYRGIGIAGIARSQTPQWMRENLPPVYAALASTGAPILHYKTCSTLDLAPHVGSIGTAIEIALEILQTGWIPSVAAPAIRRFQAFGNLFAGYGDGIHRLDRHPVMSRHPVTPYG
ncbi:MAG: four-carbon acid sugar kinase family protein [Geminicoccaceae bacterium]